jgi:hypothetical protein
VKKRQLNQSARLTFCEPYQRSASGAPDAWATMNSKAQSGVACAQLFGAV